MAEILVLGGGVAGISAAWHACKTGREAVIFEAKERWGGLLDHFMVDGFRFDNAVHFAFSSNEDYRKVLEMTEYITHKPEPYNYEQGRWLKHPVQNNLFPLPADDKVAAIKSFIERPDQTENPNYRQWLEQQFGAVIADRFPARYTEKYWTVPAEKLSTEWIGNRLYRPSLDEVLYGAMTDETPSTYYLQEMLYPKRGGFRSFLEPLAGDLDIRTGKRAIRLNPANKIVEFSDGSAERYEYLVSSVPLPELVQMIDISPDAVKMAASSLWATSAALVSLGFNCPQAGEHLWFYIYDKDIMPARVHAPYRKSPDNVPAGLSSLQFETYFSANSPLKSNADELTAHVIQAAEKMKLASPGDIIVSDFRVLPYANVVFDRGMTGRRDYVLEYIKGLGILPVGRFGLWDYLWSDQSFLSGKRVENLPV
ncbi:MAG: FAD-dependent oxidoreductase [Firmicutes bacterium]|nr:FAD-dependent oxidoreductase [Bacillota bacterium]